MNVIVERISLFLKSCISDRETLGITLPSLSLHLLKEGHNKNINYFSKDYRKAIVKSTPCMFLPKCRLPLVLYYNPLIFSLAWRAFGNGAWIHFWILVCTRRCILKAMAGASFPISAWAFLHLWGTMPVLWQRPLSLWWPFAGGFVWVPVQAERVIYCWLWRWKRFWQVEKWRKSELLTCNLLCMCVGGWETK